MNIATATPMKLQKGLYGFIFEMGTGTAKLQMKDHNSPSTSAFVDVPDSSYTESGTFNLTIASDCTVQAVLTGDAECYLLNAQ